MHESPLVISRCALLTPLDIPGSRETWPALLAGTRVEARCIVNDALMDVDTTLDRSIRLALAAARRVLPEVSAGAADTTLFCATSKGPVLTMLAAIASLRASGAPHLNVDQARQITLGVGAMGSFLAQRLNLPAGHTSVAACSSGMHALHRAAQALRRGECDRALVVAADASLHPLFEASFARLGVLAPADAQRVRRCEPLAEEGAGFFLSEAGAALLLERTPDADAKGRPVAALQPDARARPMALLEESWIGGDASGLIAIDPNTATLRYGLAACRGAGDPAFVHAHATGTSHDAYELQAIHSICGNIPVFSHKQWLGHSLGAAGLVSIALSALCHHYGITPLGTPVQPAASSLTVAQGFGGHLGVVRLRGVDCAGTASD